MDKLDSKADASSLDIVADNLSKMHDLFPEAFSEDRVDLNVLRDILGDYVDDRQERYSFAWHGKSTARRIAQTPSTGTLRPRPEESVNWDHTRNIFIEGDNLEVLKLLQKSYYGRVKMIYVDPPYNTGNEFIYPDRYQDNLDTYLRYSGQTDENGLKLSANAETSGRYHTNWLNMMYPRLRLARNLLSDDGVIFVSIDDNEQPRLRLLCDEVFGDDNFVSNIVVQSNPRGRQSAKNVAPTHEYIVAYAKNADALLFRGLGLTEEQKREFNRIDARGQYREIGLRLRGGRATAAESPTLHYPLYVNPTTCEIFTSQQSEGLVEVIPRFEDGTLGTWRWSKAKVEAENSSLIARTVSGRDGITRFDVFEKNYLTEDAARKTKSLWDERDINYDRGADAIKALFDRKVFDYSKPPALLKKLLTIATDQNATVLDLFAGSCTTAEAVFDANAEDGGNRRFIAVQLPEPCPEGSEAAKAGFATISDLGKERIRRAGDRARKDSKGTTQDTGFRSFTLDSTNAHAWDERPQDVADALFQSVGSVKADRDSDDVLFELLLKYGLDLSTAVEVREVDEGTRLVVAAGGSLMCVLQGDASDRTAGAIVAIKNELQPEHVRVVFSDACFANDVVKTNVVEILRTAGVNDVKSL